VTQLAQWRGDIGAFQANFLESTVRSLGTAKENIASSESQIRDADMAVEMTNYTRLQILQQSGMAMLSQANQSTQSILQLLQQ
jgi:flagellin